MHLKTLLFFIALSGSFLLSGELYAVNSRSMVQDSVKKVTIRVIAAEKPKELNFDSLLNSALTAKTDNKLEYTKRRNKSGRINKQTVNPSALRNTNVTNSSSDLVKKQTKEPVEASSKPVVKQNQKPSPNSVEEKHAHKVQNAQVTDEITAHGETKTTRIYLWIGFMLIVVGVILAILFGKTALLVSIAGAIFVIIGYTI